MAAFFAKILDNLRKTISFRTMTAMTTNPYAYYDDEPLPLNARPLSVSSGGEEEPDMEPRGPLELKGRFISFFRLAVRTYQINIVRDTLECRLPNGEYLQLSREEAREQVTIKGLTVDIAVTESKTYHFRCFQRSYDLPLARLKVWLQPLQTDPEKAYNAVAEQLQKHLLGTSLTWLCVIYLLWLVFMFYWNFVLVIPGSWLHLLNSLCVLPIRTACVVFFFGFLAQRLFGKVNLQFLRFGATLSLFFPVYCWVKVFVPELREFFWSNSPFFEIYFPALIYMQYNRYHRNVKQLQRENGFI